jgi:hypothetical protein
MSDSPLDLCLVHDLDDLKPKALSRLLTRGWRVAQAGFLYHPTHWRELTDDVDAPLSLHREDEGGSVVWLHLSPRTPEACAFVLRFSEYSEAVTPSAQSEPHNVSLN